MKYYFNTYYINFAISTEYSLYVKFKESCKEIAPQLKGKIVHYGDYECFNIKNFEVEYWREYKENNSEYINYHSMKRLIDKIDGDDVIFTGAGLSREAGIPTQKELESKLYLDNIEKLYIYCIQRPRELINKFRFFYLRLGIGQPTRAHLKIKEIYDKTNCTVITENIDLLHEKTKLKVIRTLNEEQVPDNRRFRRAFLIGVGNPCCQYLIKQWFDKGVEIYVISLSKPNLNINYFKWYKGSINNILL